MSQTNISESIETWLESNRRLVDFTLDSHLRPSHTDPSIIHEAMRYSVLAGGKRIRPLLAIATCETLDADPRPALQCFGALELIHTYSLVHDDLPPLDDDDLRRGHPTSHVVYGEATAILTGDALLTEAFRWMSEPIEGFEPGPQLRALRMVADAIDSTGMIGGQVLDLQGEKQTFSGTTEESLSHLESIHRNKTGRLLTASVLLGGLVAGGSDSALEELRNYGEAIGLAFQVVDDILDEVKTSAELGKTAGKDVEQNKLTYPALLGLDGARAKADELLATAIDAAHRVNPRLDVLPSIARYIISRSS